MWVLCLLSAYGLGPSEVGLAGLCLKPVLFSVWGKLLKELFLVFFARLGLSRPQLTECKAVTVRSVVGETCGGSLACEPLRGSARPA